MADLSFKGLETIAQGNSGRVTSKFDQSTGLTKNWRHLNPESQGGVCAGLVLMWLSSRRSGTTKKVFGDKYSAALFKFAEHAMAYGAGSVRSLDDVDHAAQAFSLKRASAKVMVGNKNIGKWLSHGPSPYAYIAVGPRLGGRPNHAVGGCVESGAVRFFEPNYGEFTFPDTLKFVGFLGEYLSANDMIGHYLIFYK